MSPKSNLSERDLLIELRTDLKSFKEYAKEKFERLEGNLIKLDSIESDITEMKNDVNQNTRLRNKVQSLSYWLVAELVAIIGVLITVLKTNGVI